MTFLVNLWGWTHDFGAVGLPLYQCAVRAKQFKSLVEFQEFQALQTQAEQLPSADQAAIVIEGAAVTSTNTEVSGKVRIEVLGTGQATKADEFSEK